MMSQHRPLLPTQDINTDGPEDDGESDYSIQAAQDLLKKNTSQKKLIICGCIFLLILVVAAAVTEAVLFNVANLVQKEHGGLEGLAYSKIFDYIDPSYDPCKDFYNFSCGGWYNSKPDISNWGTSVELIMENYKSLAGYLSEPPRSDDPDALKKAKYAYSACTDTDYIKDHYVEELSSFMINQGGGWDNGDFFPSKPWNINESLYKDHYLGSVALFNFAIEPDDLNSSKPVIRIYQAGLTLGSPEDYKEPDFDLAYTIEYILNKINPDGNYHYLAQDIADFERHLAYFWLTQTELRNASATYNPMTLDDLTKLFQIDWVYYFNNYFKEAGYSGGYFSGSTMVIVDTPSYFRQAAEFLKSSSLEDYAKWQLLISTYAVYTASLPIDSWKASLLNVKFPNTVRLVSGTTLACVEHLENSMPLAVARPFVEEFIVNSTQLKVAKMAEGLKVAFKERIVKKDWLDETTKQRSVEKVNAITEQIAYPDFIEIDRELDNVYADLRISKETDYFDAVSAMQEFTVRKMLSNYFHATDKTEWLDPPTKVNAYYSPQFNQFVVLAGILRPPFFSPDWFQFLIYGALGTVIGHELTHGFDDQGQKYNKDGNRVKWWTDPSIKNFDNLTKCFVNQYNGYTLQGFKINGELTLGENIADNGGIHLSYRAYKNAMNGTTEMDIAGYTGDQLFFMAFAQLWCSSFSDDSLKTRLQTDPHSPGPIRVLGSLVNSEDFTNAFQCPLGSAMYPSDNRCELW